MIGFDLYDVGSSTVSWLDCIEHAKSKNSHLFIQESCVVFHLPILHECMNPSLWIDPNYETLVLFFVQSILSLSFYSNVVTFVSFLSMFLFVFNSLCKSKSGSYDYNSN